MARAADQPPRPQRSPARVAEVRPVRPAALPMSRAAGGPLAAARSAAVVPSVAARTSVPVSSVAARAPAAPTPTSASGTAPGSIAGVAARPASAGSTTASRTPARAGATQASTAAAATTSPATTSAVVRGQPLPLRFRTGIATKVITVTAASTSSTTARLQAWTKAAGGGWLKHGRSVLAHIGADGLSTRPSESRSATPIGTFTLTRAFGRDANPGTSLPYLHTRPSDWWISQPGPLYNTHQRCASNCPFRLGDPNEHLYYETPYYDYAMVIDYNTPNSPTGVVPGAGSAFFLHVTDGTPTAGCVAVAQWKVIALLRWLAPAAHPRILIGVG